MKKMQRVLFFFPHMAGEDVIRIERKEIPSERLYGLVELRARGWNVEIADERFHGKESAFAARLRSYGFDLSNFRALRRAMSCDILLVKDEFSLLLSLLARLSRKRIIYLDSLFFIPKHPLRRLLARMNLRLAPCIVGYSRHQVELWSREFSVSMSKFSVLPYTIDYPFYRQLSQGTTARNERAERYVLAVGRDLGRDFQTLVLAAERVGLNVKLVTLPYLIPMAVRNARHVEVLQNISYRELFELYAGARMVVVPLKRDVSYPSGIRAVMESLAAGKATIVSRTPILEEYFPVEDGTLMYVDGEDVERLSEEMRRVDQDDALRESLERRGPSCVASRYQMGRYVDALEGLLARQV